MATDKKLIQQAVEGNTPKWCDHIYFWYRVATEVDGMDVDACGGWSLKSASMVLGLSLDKWNFCPICGTPNPSCVTSRSGNMVEHDIGQSLAAAWNDFVILDQTHPQHPRLFLDGIHACQQVMMWREQQRANPEKYPSFAVDKIAKSS